MGSHNVKKIVILTGTRADFGKLKSIITVLLESKKFDVHIFATGMHMNPKYGSTVNEIKKCGFTNIYEFINHTSSSSLDSILATTITGFGNYVSQTKPDMIVVHGDRIEALAGALVGSLNNILVSHIEGGEISGSIDELIRHAISKIAHLHFVANKQAKRRLIQMGEDENNVFIIGSPDIDILRLENLPTLKESKTRYEIPYDTYAFVLYHPVTTEMNNLSHHINTLVDSLLESKKNYIVIYPNNDPGTDIILSTYKDRLTNNEQFKIFPSMRFEQFLTLLKNSQFIIGNSSSGIREAPYYGIPVINIGTRQNNRVKENIECIYNCDYDKENILQSINKFSNNHARYEPIKIFGHGDSDKKFLDIVMQDLIWKTNFQKRFLDVAF